MMTTEIKNEVAAVEITPVVKKAVKKVKTKAKTAPKAKEPKVKLGAFAVQLMLKGKTNEQVLRETKKRFPKSKVSENSIAWYRSTARKQGLKIKTDRELLAK